MQTEKLRVLVLGGGPSAEHDVSLNSAEKIFESLRPDRYEATLATITKDGVWLIPSFAPMDTAQAIPRLHEITDLVFIALHGEYGEDGTLQSLFDNHRVRYTGSGAVASRIGMHKLVTRDRLRVGGLPVPRAFGFAYDTYERSHDEIVGIIAKKFLFPIVVKPMDRGSSVGVSIVHSLLHLEPGIHNVFHYSPYAMTEDFVSGIELSCGVVEMSNNKLIPLLPTEIVPNKGTFFNYESKYSNDGAEEVTPARIPKSVLQRTQAIAVSAHTLLGCSGYSRTDLIWDQKKDRLNVLEINTLPGLTQTSLLPQQALACGIRFSELLDNIIASALRK